MSVWGFKNNKVILYVQGKVMTIISDLRIEE